MKLPLFLGTLLLSLTAMAAEYDVVIYGGTSAAIGGRRSHGHTLTTPRNPRAP